MSAPRRAEALLETLLVAAGEPVRLERHRARMARSAAALGWSFDPGAFDRAVADALAEGACLRARMRLLLAPSGSCIAALSPLDPPPGTVTLALSAERVLSAEPLARHKVLPRELYEAARSGAEAAGAWDGLLLNERGEVAETGRASVAALLGGELLTPPLGAGILAGTTRELLLERGALREATLTPADLERARGLFVLNALAGAAAVSGILGLEGYRPDPQALASGRGALLGALAEPGARGGTL